MEFFQALCKLTGKEINQHNVGLFVDKGILKPICTEFRNLKFYHYEGIYFKCVQCGNCCHEDVPLEDFELETGLFPDTKTESLYSYSWTGKFINKKDGEPCPFMNLETKKCKIYEQRPLICRKYPFAENVARYWERNAFIFYVDNLDNDRACKGYHIGKMKITHLKPFVRNLKLCLRRTQYNAEKYDLKAQQDYFAKMKRVFRSMY
jgi:Fe-S-cluster containining protein